MFLLFQRKKIIIFVVFTKKLKYSYKIVFLQNLHKSELLLLSVTRLLVTVNLTQSACSVAEHHSEMISTFMFGVLGSDIFLKSGYPDAYTDLCPHNFHLIIILTFSTVFFVNSLCIIK
jgi:hypothetical protein